jgi:EAL domain-containing protein (putative c-di-GMP-specific phosphodiesterase class I)
MHPQHGMISPAEFIPLAEENGLISSIGEWVLYQACRDAETWSESTTVSVNVSPRQFRDGSVPSIVEAALQASRLHPSRLVLEITESILLHETDANLEMLHRIRALGVVIALDDFGKGFSSLSYLQSFPFDKVKIDRSFVQHVGTSQQSEKILEAMTGLLSSLGISVTIEGVETEQQRDWLSRLNCQEMQGFLFGYPLPIEKFITKTSCS